MPTLRPNPTKTAKASTSTTTGASSNGSSRTYRVTSQQPSQDSSQTAPEVKLYEPKDLQHYASRSNMILPDTNVYTHLAYLSETPKGEPFRTRWHHNINGLPSKKDREFKEVKSDKYQEYLKEGLPTAADVERAIWNKFIGGSTEEQSVARILVDMSAQTQEPECAQSTREISSARGECPPADLAHQPLPRDEFTTMKTALDVLRSTAAKKKREKRENEAPCDCHQQLERLRLCRCAACPQKKKPHHTWDACHCVLKDSELHKEVSSPKLRALPENASDKQVLAYMAEEAKLAEQAARERGELIRLKKQLYETYPHSCRQVNYLRADNFAGELYSHFTKLDSAGRWEMDGSQMEIDGFTIIAQRSDHISDKDPRVEDNPTEAGISSRETTPIEDLSVEATSHGQELLSAAGGTLPADAALPAEEVPRSAVNELAEASGIFQAPEVKDGRTLFPTSRPLPYDVNEYLQWRDARNGSKTAGKEATIEPTYKIVNGKRKPTIKFPPKSRADTKAKSSHVSKKQKITSSDANPTTPVVQVPASTKRKSGPSQSSTQRSKRQRTMAGSSSLTSQQMLPAVSLQHSTMTMASTAPSEQMPSIYNAHSAQNTAMAMSQDEPDVNPAEPASFVVSASVIAELRSMGLTSGVWRGDDIADPLVWERPAFTLTKGLPSWKWVAWGILVRAPEYSLPLHKIAELGRAWVPILAHTKNQTVRAALSREVQFINQDRRTRLWRLTGAYEPSPRPGRGPARGPRAGRGRQQNVDQGSEEDSEQDE